MCINQRFKFFLFTLVSTLVSSGISYGVTQQDILFYASFQNSVDADISAGDGKAIKSKPEHILFEECIVGMGLGTKEPYGFEYNAKENINEEKGSITFWYYIENWDPNDKEYYNFFHIDAGDNGYTYFYRVLGGGSNAQIISRVYVPSRKDTIHQRFDFPMVEARKWHFIVMTWEGEKVNVYLNGELLGHTDSYIFPKGWKKFGFYLCHHGRKLDEITIYNKVLSLHEVKNIYQQTGFLHTDNIVSISRKVNPIKIDGLVTTEEWGRYSQVLGLYNSNTGCLSKPDSHISLCYDDQYVYIAFETAIPDEVLADIPGKLLKGLLKQTAYKHDEDVERDDAVGIHIVPDSNKRDWYRFVVNGLNTHYEYYVSKDTTYLAWDPEWKSASTVDLNGWHVEIAIPISEIKTQYPNPRTIWWMNFLRYWRLVKNELQLWSWGIRDRNTRNQIFSDFHSTDHSNGSMGKIIFAGDNNVNVRMISIGKLDEGNIDFTAELINTYKEKKKINIELKSDTLEVNESKIYELEPETVQKFTFRNIVSTACLLSFQVKNVEDKTVYFSSETPFFIKQSLDIIASYFPGFDKLKLWMDLRPLSNIPLDELKVKITINEKDKTKSLLTKNISQFTNYQSEVEIIVSELKPGKYEIITEISSGDNKVIKEVINTFEKKQLPEWYGNKIGISDKVPTPFIPLKVDKKEDTISCWGRKYEFKENLFPNQVITQGESILTDGIELRLVDNLEKSYTSKDEKCLVKWKKITDARVEYERILKLGSFEVKADSWIEYDGFIWTKLHVETKDRTSNIKELVMDIPYKKEWAELINPADYSTVSMGRLKSDGWYGSTDRPVWLGNGIGGMQWTCEASVTYRLKNENFALHVIPEDDRVIFRVTFIDSGEKITEPFEVEFGLVATPTRPRTPDYRRINSANSTVKINFGLWQLYTFICDPSRIKVDREKIANMWQPVHGISEYAFSSSAPYSSTYAMATETDEFRYWGAEWTVQNRFVYAPNLNQPMEERVSPTCQGVKSWQDFYVWSYWNLYQKQRFRGIYHDDGIAICNNLSHNHGYLKGSTIQSIKSVLGKREINKRLYTMLRELESQKKDEGYAELQGLTYIIQHHSGYLDMAWGSFCDYYADGENFVGQLRQDKDCYRIYSPDKFKAQSMGHNFGPACWFLEEFIPAGIGKQDGSGWSSYEPVLYLFSLILLHDSTYWMCWEPSDAYAPYINALRYCNWGDQYRMIPYWEQKVVELPENQYATFYIDEKAKRVIMIFLNNNEEGGVFDYHINWKELGFESWERLKTNSVHPVPTEIIDGKLKFLKDEWERRWFATPTAEIKDGRLEFSYDRVCSRFIVIEKK